MKDAVLQLAGPAYTSQEQPDGYVRRLEAACQLLHEGLRPPRATGAPSASSGSAAHNVPPAASPTPSAAGSISAGKLCTLLLTDQELLDVVLGLHDIRAAQLCHLMPWSGSHALKLPPPSEALAKQLSQSQRSVPGSQLLAFVKTLERESSLKGDPLLRVWDSMHRAVLLVLAALQSLPIRPHPQHPDPAATTHTSATTQLPPGYHRCSACLLLSLRLALCLAQHCAEQPLGKEAALARLHKPLRGLLLGLSTSVTVMQAAGHSEAQAQRVQFVRCMLHLASKLSALDTDPRAISSIGSSRGHGSSMGQASSGGPRGNTGRSGASQSAGDKLHSLALNSYGFLGQALCDVIGRQEQAFARKELITTCRNEGPGGMKELWKDVVSYGAMALSKTYQMSIRLQLYLDDPAKAARATKYDFVPFILGLLARCVPEYQCLIVVVDLTLAIGAAVGSTFVGQQKPELFLPNLAAMYATLYKAVMALTELMPDWRCLPAVLRTGLRVATAGALAHHTMVSLLPSTGQVNRMPHTTSGPSLLPPTVLEDLPKLEKEVSNVSLHATYLWSLVLAQDGVEEPSMKPFQVDDSFRNRLTTDKVAVLPSPSSPQLAPLALDLVLGMENTLQMVMRQQDMVWKCPFWNDGNLVQSLADGYRTLLALFGHVIELLATPSVVGPAGLAAQPASWLPCGNSLVEGWCTRLLAGVCKLMCIDTPDSADVPLILKMMLNRRLQGSYRLLLRGQRQAPPSMSPEAERLLSCLTLVLTTMVPQDLCLALAAAVANTVPEANLASDDVTTLSKLQPEQVWTWQALAAGTPAEATLQGLLSALASLFQVQGLVTPIAPGWRHQRLTLALGEWHEL